MEQAMEQEEQEEQIITHYNNREILTTAVVIIREIIDSSSDSSSESDDEELKIIRVCRNVRRRVPRILNYVSHIIPNLYNTKDHNSRSGNNKRTWKYYDAMESFLGEKRYMSPLSLISSTGQSSFERSKSPSPCSSSSSTCQSDSKVSRKRKAADAMEKIVENRRITEEGKDRRHKERMEMQKKFMEKLDKILDKL